MILKKIKQADVLVHNSATKLYINGIYSDLIICTGFHFLKHSLLDTFFHKHFSLFSKEKKKKHKHLKS